VETFQNLKATQELIIKIEKNMTASGKTNQPSSSRATNAKNEMRSRAANTTKPASDRVTALIDVVRCMESGFTQHNTSMQNRLVQLERH